MLTRHLIAPACLALALMWPAWADDTEIYTKTGAAATQQVLPNVLLIIETSDSLVRHSLQPNTSTVHRENSLLHQAVTNAHHLIQYYEDNKIPIKIGLMRYKEFRGELLVPVKQLDGDHATVLIGELMQMLDYKMGLFGEYTISNDANSDGIHDNCQDESRRFPWTHDACPRHDTSQSEYLADPRVASSVGALNEAWRYFQGMAWTSGLRPEDPEAISDIGRYQSPIEYECQSNHVLVFTDGDHRPGLVNVRHRAPAHFNPECAMSERNSLCLSRMTDYMHTTDARTDLEGDQNIETHFVYVNGNTGTLAPDPVNMPLGDPQVSRTRTMQAAIKGGGEWLESNSHTELLFSSDNRQENFLNDLASAFGSTIPPQIGSQYTTRKQTISDSGEVAYTHHVYYGMFQPEEHKRWLGNLKKYGLAVDGNGRVTQVVDKNGDPAIENGKIKSEAISYWRLNNEPDGDQIKQGGAADRLSDYDNDQHSVNDRRVYTWNSQTETDFPVSLSRIMPEGTSRRNDRFVIGRSGLYKPGDERNTPEIRLDPDRPSNRVDTCSGTPIPIRDENNRISRRGRALGNWIRGADICDEDEDAITSDGRSVMGSVRHGRPVVVPFGGDIGDVMLLLSNDGYLHLLQTDEPDSLSNNLTGDLKPGLELAAIFPGTQLESNNLIRAYDLFENKRGTPLHQLDGDITLYIEDTNNDGDLLDNADKAIAYFGQRRGGRNLFAIDLGKPGNFDMHPPELLWHIQGGIAGNDFEDMGETWSTPHYTKIKKRAGNHETLPVLLFGGGYDPEVDCDGGFASDGRDCMETSRPGNQYGNAVYIVNANDGTLLWKGQPAAMDYSFPAPLKIFENPYGVLKGFFAVDSGGLVWRYDISEFGVTIQNKRINAGISGGIIANLYGGDGTSEKHHRRFYNAPDIAYSRDVNNNPQLRLNIGSGYRAHPLDTGTQDRMYSLVQPTAKPDRYASTPAGCTRSSLDGCLISVELFELDKTPVDDATKLDNGWYLNLDADAGEKVLSAPVTLLGRIFFATYTPATTLPTPRDDPEDLDLGTTRLYIVDSGSGNAVLNLSEDGNQNQTGDDALDAADRSIVLDVQGIAPSPELVFDADGAQVLIGTDLIEDSRVEFNQAKRRILYWTQDEP